MSSFSSQEVQHRPTGAERRRSPRFAVRIDAVLHANGTSQPTIIDDLSVGGAGLDVAIGIYANDTVELELADGRRLPGQVAWWLSGACGVQFAEPLQPNDRLFEAAN